VAKTFTVFSAPHPLQGSGFVAYVDDPHYADLIDDLLSTGVDFVFEEAGGRKPSIAETLVESFLGLGHYMDVDPPLYERHEYGIVSRAKPRPNLFGCEYAVLEEQRQREEVWMKRIVDQPFGKGLMICGLCHCLSLAFRLASAGINVEGVHSYMPYSKLCNLQHN
jgi:hypothetical protein